MGLSTKIRQIGWDTGTGNWQPWHDIAQRWDLLNGAAILSEYDSRCLRNHLIECYPDSAEDIVIATEEYLIRRMRLLEDQVFDSYDWGDPELAKIITERYR